MKKAFHTRKDAEATLSAMNEIIHTYGVVTIEDLNDLVAEESSYLDNQYGWIDISSVTITKNGELYDVVFPMPVLIANPMDAEVDHPSHYQMETGLEVIEVIEAATFDLKGIEAFNTGNIIKYACRWKHKNGIQDLEKIMWYTQHLIDHLKNSEKENG